MSSERRFDWVVVGGGITGLCAARRLAELAPDASIALVEADRIGRTTAGRNSGFFVDLPHDISSESYSRSVEADRTTTVTPCCSITAGPAPAGTDPAGTAPAERAPPGAAAAP